MALSFANIEGPKYMLKKWILNLINKKNCYIGNSIIKSSSILPKYSNWKVQLHLC